MTTETLAAATETKAPPVDLSEQAGDPPADNPNPEIVADPPPAPAAAEAADDDAAPEPVAPNRRAESMKRIADRLKQQRAGQTERAAQQAPAAAEPEPAAAAPAPVAAEPAAPAEPAPPPAPRVFKLKVDREELERDITEVARLADMTVEEVEADPERARKYAGRELASRHRLDQANEILRNANPRPQESRGAPGSPPNPEERRTADDTEPVPEPSAAQPGKFRRLIEDIQFGRDPDAVAAQLQEAVNEAASNVATSAAQRVSVEERFRQDHAHTIRAYETMKAAEPALFADPNAEAVMSRMMFDGYRQDLRASGMPDDQIPTNNAQLVDLHRLSRIQGKSGIRSAAQLLGDVKQGYVEWRGGTPAKPAAAPADPAAPASPAPRPVPRVVVNRDERRQAIPTQPQRASAPPPPPAQSPQPQTREQKLAKMRAARGQK